MRDPPLSGRPDELLLVCVEDEQLDAAVEMLGLNDDITPPASGAAAQAAPSSPARGSGGGGGDNEVYGPAMPDLPVGVMHSAGSLTDSVIDMFYGPDDAEGKVRARQASRRALVR